MNIKIHLDVDIKNKTRLPIIALKEKIYDYTNNSYIEYDINYPTENIIEFQVKNLENNSANIKIVKIELDNIETNQFYNTYFHMYNNQWVEEKVLTSISDIVFNGSFKLYVDDLYVRAARSNNWHCSGIKEDFIFQYEFVRSSFVEFYRDRNHKGFHQNFVPCFGCSFTYGAAQQETDTWPYLLAQKLERNFLNLGVGGSGIDGIYNNLKLLYRKHKFNQCVILLPNFERRIVRCKIEDLWIRIFSTIDIFQTNNTNHFYTNTDLRDKMKKVKEKIMKDVDNRYAKKILSKIIHFCKKNNIQLYCSSWNNDVYDYLKCSKDIIILPKFPKLSMFRERADDDRHPHKRHYEFFVNQVKDFF